MFYCLLLIFRSKDCAFESSVPGPSVRCSVPRPPPAGRGRRAWGAVPCAAWLASGWSCVSPASLLLGVGSTLLCSARFLSIISRGACAALQSWWNQALVQRSFPRPERAVPGQALRMWLGRSRVLGCQGDYRPVRNQDEETGSWVTGK